ncbi:nitrous oxide-stimulated promoter family protein [Vagococcus hydrophili]|uniref:Nitrous oxide-stimulated promoter family protein n=1 Tax=Vagococcus hydrophili TaxID=2714947 RepID=A0A6G8AS82_9ENTE|nr:nitrous oxide-stimulated promoter family protein [Vagococcus hydrophili]QIL47829.1 nitrous oxide-stimulated promoter family protein [Vagococcus hydrophili]
MVRAINEGPKISFEKKTVSAMIEIYYKQFSDEAHQLEEEDVANYAMARLNYCRFGEDKPTCKVCPVHCYKKSYKDKMQQIMRYSGPRMLIYHPVMSVEHFMKEWRYKRVNK